MAAPVVHASGPFKSPVWQYFGFAARDGAADKTATVCKLCQCSLKYVTGSTTSMASHLKRRHGIVAENAKTVKDANSTSSQSKRLRCFDDEQLGLAKGQMSCKFENAQRTLQDCFACQTSLPFNSPRAQTITKSIGIFIAKDMRPYSVVENSGFKQMVASLEPRYKIPSRTHFAEKVIPKMYEETKKMVVSSLAEADYVALTTDSWTSRATESFITVTVHFIQNWQMKSHILQTTAMQESHTADNLADFLNQVVISWGLKRKNEMPSFTTDNAKNIVNASKQINANPHVGCLAHTLNLATQKCLKLPEMETLLSKIRHIVSFFHRSTTATAILKVKQGILELPKLKLINDVSTRWNSTFDMLERFLSQQQAIEATLMAKEVKKNSRALVSLSEDDTAAAEKVLHVLKPLKMITTILCDEKSPTVSMIQPLKAMVLRQLAPVVGDIPLVTTVKAAIHNNLEPRYGDPSVLLFLDESSCIDPRFKTMPYLTDRRRHEVFSSLAQKAAASSEHIIPADKQVKLERTENAENDVEPDTNTQTPALPNLQDFDDGNPAQPPPAKIAESMPTSTPDGPTPAKKSRTALEDLFGDVFVTKIEAKQTLESVVDQEIVKYKTLDSTPLCSNPLEWWRAREDAFPHLSHLAKKYLCIPATSVASERVFSTAGNIVTAQRSCLSADQVDTLVFLQKNLR